MNSLSIYKTEKEKKAAYLAAVNKNAVALTETGQKVPLRSLPSSQVDFVGGLWRVQRKFDAKIQVVRDKNFVLLKRLPHQEKNLFEFYEAAQVYENCYGKQISNAKVIVAKYDTLQGTFWSYGLTIEQARAFLGIRLYDEYMDLIHHVANKQVKTR